MTHKNFYIKARILSSLLFREFIEIKVEAWHPQLSPDVPLITVTINTLGEFQIILPEFVYRRLSSERQPSLFFKIFRDGKLIEDHVPMPPFTPRITDTEIIAEIVLTVDLFAEEKLHPELSPIRFLVSGLVTRDGKPLSDVIVRAFDKDLPRLSPNEQLLGSAVTDEQGRYEITYTAAQFTRAEKGSADLVVLVYDREEKLLAESPIYYNAPAETTININIPVTPTPEPPAPSEYERLVETITPTLGRLQLADLKAEDIEFLAGEHRLERERLEMLVEAARHSREAGERELPAAIFYGLLRQGLPREMRALTDLEPVRLRRALEASAADNVIPARFREGIEETLKSFSRVRDRQLVPVRRTVTIQLINQTSGKPLTNGKVHLFDIDIGAGAEPVSLGMQVSNLQGRFQVSYTVIKPRNEADRIEETDRWIRLQIRVPETEEPLETDFPVNTTQREPFVVRVPVPVPPEPAGHDIRELARITERELPTELSTFLERKGIRTLSDIRRRGGLSKVEELPALADAPMIKMLDAQAYLAVVSNDVKINAALIESGYTNILTIANAPPQAIARKTNGKVDEKRATVLQAKARAQVSYLTNTLAESKANLANGFKVPSMADIAADVASGIEIAKCKCEDCNSAVSPLAYLTDLLEYAITHVTNKSEPITLEFLTKTFHQPFGKLPLSCSSANKKVLQVRLCIEALRSYLKTALSGADLVTYTTRMQSVQQDYDRSMYFSLLKLLGVVVVP